MQGKIAALLAAAGAPAKIVVIEGAKNLTAIARGATGGNEDTIVAGDPAILTPLLEFIRATGPDLVAISGDLTQRARTAEFEAARGFLDMIPFPKIVVPGNHSPADTPWGRH